jgi:hypothetical protein
MEVLAALAEALQIQHYDITYSFMLQLTNSFRRSYRSVSEGNLCLSASGRWKGNHHYGWPPSGRRYTSSAHGEETSSDRWICVLLQRGRSGPEVSIFTDISLKLETSPQKNISTPLAAAAKDRPQCHAIGCAPAHSSFGLQLDLRRERLPHP